jgi:protein-histidine pros-kinase
MKPVARRWRLALAQWLLPFNLAVQTCAVLIGVLIWSAVSERVEFERTEAESQAFRETANLAIAAQQHAANTLEDIQQTLDLLVREFQRGERAPRLDLIYDNGAIASGLYSLLFIADEHGDVVAGSRALSQPNVARREYFRFHESHPGAGMYVGRPLSLGSTGRPIIPVSRRIDDADGKFAGVAVASVDPAYFSRFYRRLVLGDGGLVRLVGRDGIVRVGQRAGVAQWGTNVSDAAFFQEEMSAPLGSGVSEDKRGIRRYTSYRTLDKVPLIVEVGVPEDDVLAGFRQRRQRYCTIAAVGTVALALAAFGIMFGAARQRKDRLSLVESEAHFRATFEQAALGIAHVDLRGAILAANPRYCTMLGLGEQDLRQKTLADIVHPDDWPTVTRRLARVAEQAPDAGSGPLEHRNVRTDGTVVWVSAAVALVRDEKGLPQYFVAMMKDISARKEAEARYRATFSQAGVGIAHVGPDGRVIQSNATLAKMLLYSVEEMAGLSVADIVPADHLEAIRLAQSRWQAAPADGVATEFAYVRRDGERGWAAGTFSPVHDGWGGVAYFIAVIQDVTERCRATEEARESSRRFRETLSNLDLIAVMLDLEGRVTYCNGALLRATGFELDEVLGADWFRLFVPDDAARMRTLVVDLLAAAPHARHCEYEIQARSGERRLIRWSNSPLRGADGVVTGAASIGEDITELRELERNRLRAQQSEAASRLKSEFLATMSHELRTPLNAIIGFSEMVRDELAGPLNPEQREYMGYVSSAGDHLLSLINDILDLSKVEAGHMDLVLEPCSVSALLTGSMAIVRERARSHRIALTASIESDLDDIVLDERKVRQILYNLLSNAVKFTPDDGAVVLSARRASGNGGPYLEIAVSDTGIGMAPEHLDRLFQPFVQVDSALNRQHQGTGLGLALVKRLAELHGGDVSVWSAEGNGSTFTVRLPWRVPSAADAAIPCEAQAAS